MTIREAMDEVLANRPMPMDEGFLLKWLSRCEAMVDTTVVQRYQDAPEPFQGFGPDTDEGTELTAGQPHDSLYVYWLEAQLHYANGDIDRYNNAITQFNTELAAFRREYARKHRARQAGRFRF